jgi:signal transduction histidine kinase
MLIEDPSMQVASDDAKRWLQMIKRNAETSLRLIRDLLDMERIVGGKLQLELAPCRMSELTREVLETFTHAAAAKRVKINLSVMPVESSVVCDRDRVAQVLSNIIGNALKFTPEGGSIIVKTDETESEFKFSVRDWGPGIPEDQREHIFERFAQIGNKSRSGLGLGLYISRTLVDSHHGKLWVDCFDGEGSEFSFTLPKKPTESIQEQR